MKSSFSIIILILLITYANTVFAQKEASVWSMGNGKQINFQKGEFDLKIGKAMEM